MKSNGTLMKNMALNFQVGSSWFFKMLFARLVVSGNVGIQQQSVHKLCTTQLLCVENKAIGV